MDELVTLLSALNSLSPLAVIALLAVIIYKQVMSTKQVGLISDNHLSGLPEMLAALSRIEITLAKMDTYLHARLNGGGYEPDR